MPPPDPGGHNYEGPSPNQLPAASTIAKALPPAIAARCRPASRSLTSAHAGIRLRDVEALVRVHWFLRRPKTNTRLLLS